MSIGRRAGERRRRVVYSAYQADQDAAAPPSRNEVQRLREARRPPEAYGSHVHRRLRARWFSLVPVGRRAMTVVCGWLLGVVTLICFAHYVAVAWPSIAYRPEIARPLRLDRPDSFGHCLMVVLLLASTGASLLIYQLRRYRNDDFKGRYRLWRLVIIALFLASINAVVGIMDWGGAVLDAIFGRRVTLSGSEWIRLAVTTISVILAIRLIAEVRRCRAAMAWMIAGGTLLTIPEAVKWNALSVESLERWIVVTSAPLLASTALFLSLGVYLRMLYREVRRIPDGESIWERFHQLRARWTGKSTVETDQQVHLDQDDEGEAMATESRRGWFQFLRRRKPSTEKAQTSKAQTSKVHAAKVHAAKVPTAQAPTAQPPTAQAPTAQAPTAQARAAQPTVAAPTVSEAKPVKPARPAEPAKPEVQRSAKRRSILRWFWPKKRDSDESPSDKPSTNPAAPRGGSPPKSMSPPKPTAPLRPVSAPRPSEAEELDDDGDERSDGENMDLNQLNKSDRRRMRKQLKRQHRAA